MDIMVKEYKHICLTLGDDKVRFLLLHQASLVKKNLRKYEHWVYDLGLPKDIKEELLRRGVKLISWSDICGEHDKLIGNNKDNWKRTPFPTVTLASLKKIFCIKHCVESNSQKDLVIRILYIDADAFPLRDLGDIWGLKFNLGVTLRKCYKRSLDLSKAESPMKFRYKLLNAGVQFWQGSQDHLLYLINYHINKYIVDKRNFADQTALNRLVDECRGFDWTTLESNYDLVLNKNHKYVVRVMSCKYYNWFTKQGKAPDKKIIICHAKGRKKAKLRSEKDVINIIDRSNER
jgi:hypothetical protein